VIHETNSFGQDDIMPDNNIIEIIEKTSLIPAGAPAPDTWR
jgi:hypothetical protein